MTFDKWFSEQEKIVKIGSYKDARYIGKEEI